MSLVYLERMLENSGDSLQVFANLREQCVSDIFGFHALIFPLSRLLPMSFDIRWDHPTADTTELAPNLHVLPFLSHQGILIPL